MDKSLLMSKLQNFECGLMNEIEQIPHKLLSEKYFVSIVNSDSRIKRNSDKLIKRTFSFLLKDELENLRELTLEVFNNYLYVKEFEPCLTKEGFRRLFSLIGRNAQGKFIALNFKSLNPVVIFCFVQESRQVLLARM